MIKKLLKSIIPDIVKSKIIAFRNDVFLFRLYMYDYHIYRTYNASKVEMNLPQIEGKIIAHYHVLEKGISHPKTKKCFSLPLVKNLIHLVQLFDTKSDFRSQQVNIAVEMLNRYKNLPLHKDNIPKELVDKIDAMNGGTNLSAGSIEFTKDDFFSITEGDFSALSRTRYTVRDFTSEDVCVDSLKQAIEIAQKTPSVCNRQTVRISILTKREDIDAHLSLQNGNRGFGEKINKLLIITSDMNLFGEPRERNQAFVDGGMFAMSLLYSLHYLKLGAVTLNWAYDAIQNERFHDLGFIPKNEKVILLIGVGHVPSKFKVAMSGRRTLEEIINIK